MNPNLLPINILVSCPHGCDPRMATLVFKTIRVGFPKNPLEIFIKAEADAYAIPVVKELMAAPGGSNVHWYACNNDLRHWDWIDQRIEKAPVRPFIICDTDMVFHQDCTPLFVEADCYNFIGEEVPMHSDVVTGLVMERKYHTALLLVNVDGSVVWDNRNQAIYTRRSARPLAFKNIYYDTLALIQNECRSSNFPEDPTPYFSHLHCGSWAQHIHGPFGIELQKLHLNILNGLVPATVVRPMFKQYLVSRGAHE